MNEAFVTIEGVNLTDAEVMTLRVALGAFITDMQKPDALGSDERGQSMAAGYLQHARRLEMLLVAGANRENQT